MRFSTARDVQLAFPQMSLGFQSPLDGTPSYTYLNQLLDAGKPADAIAFAAHLLPRREAVWWAARCARHDQGALAVAEEEAIAAAERWVREPTEAHRRQVLALGDRLDPDRPAGMVARAAGWSGGAIIEADGGKLMSQAHMSHAAARGAVLLAFAEAPDPHAFARRSIDEAITLLKRNTDR